MASCTPWASTCLVQALAGLLLLRQRGVSGTLYLGMARQPNGPESMSAYAWLRCGSVIVTGAAGREHHTVIAAFAVAEPQAGPYPLGQRRPAALAAGRPAPEGGASRPLLGGRRVRRHRP